jgi:pyruvate dehydrogenase E2 component (dihydrolipoamide acetyltransferase)
MATNILMPALSPTMTEGTLARWLKKEGDAIRSGDVIAEIETDKATMEVEAVDEGTLGKILVPEGTQGVAVNAPIAVLVADGESASGPAAAAAPSAPRPASRGETAPQDSGPAPASAPINASSPPNEGTSSRAPQPQMNGHDAHGGERLFASPLARRMAQQAGLDLHAIKGTGPNGRIIRADVEAAQGKAPAKGSVQPEAGARETEPPKPAAAPPPAPQPAVVPAPKPPAAPITAPHTLTPHTTMRRVIARRLTAAKQEVPHFYLSVDVELDALLKLRTELNARSPKDGPGAFKLSVNDLVIKASAVALRRVPGVNASWTEEGTVQYQDVDISVAVAIPDGLITPIIRRADQKGLAAISTEMRELAGRAKAGKLKPEEFQGGGFSISNLGMYGVKEFAAVINPPQGAILAVGAGDQRPVVKSGALAVATVMTCTLSVDHRVVDGALGAQWLQAFKGLVEDPMGLIL